MTRLRPAIVIAAIILVAMAASMLFNGSNRERMLSGYIEGENLYLASPVAGTVTSVAAVEGTRVAAGQPLFSVDPATLTAQGQQAQPGSPLRAMKLKPVSLSAHCLTNLSRR